MKEYKIDLSMHEGKVRELVSEAVQLHAFKLGYEWRVGKEILGEKSPYLFFYKSSTMTHLAAEDVRHFEDNSGIKISAYDFLALTPEDVQDAPKEPEFKPDQLVLAREGHGETWCLCHFSHRWENGRFCVGDTTCRYCIPYEGNEHLLGTTEEPK